MGLRSQPPVAASRVPLLFPSVTVSLLATLSLHQGPAEANTTISVWCLWPLPSPASPSPRSACRARQRFLSTLALSATATIGAPSLDRRIFALTHVPTLSIPTAIEAIRNIGKSSGLFVPTFSEDPALFTQTGLEGFDAIAFLSNSNVVDSAGDVTSDVLDDAGVDALREWLTVAGHGLVGLHAATACLFEDKSFGVGMGSWCVKEHHHFAERH